MSHLPRLASIRPLVRYVDESQAVIDLAITLVPPLPMPSALRSEPSPETIDVFMQVEGPDGSIDEQMSHVPLRDHGGSARLQVVQPMRWWPAGMGEQALYRIRAHVLSEQGGVIDSRLLTLGFTSIRRASPDSRPDRRIEFLVNSRECPIEAVVPIDLVHERRLLPVCGQSLLLVRGHYGPDVLYDAADRAGIMLIQCVPLDAEGAPESDVPGEVDRLSSHPSLAGWFVGHLGVITDRIERRLRDLDPTRHVFRSVPGQT
ncbi:MAG: hypothetical protein K8S99_15730 [Planctomycetes bacterium]|nr:hypothetical protein [Planctomycetota bacterium]